MKKTYFFPGLLFLLFLFSCTQSKNFDSALRDLDFNLGWSFMNDSVLAADSAGVMALELEDENWINVDIPHDWSIMDLPGKSADNQIGPFSKKSPGGLSTGNTLGGTGWYRKSFVTEKYWNEKQVSIRFDGVYMRSDVWINGHHLGFHPYGYTPFTYDLTPYLEEEGRENLLIVRVRNYGRNSRWYNGSGIYRQVSVCITNPVHFPQNGVLISTHLVSKEKASLHISTEIDNAGIIAGPGVMRIRVSDPKGVVVLTDSVLLNIKASKNEKVELELNMQDPTLWSPASPSLYAAELELVMQGEVTDRISIPFGIRSIAFSVEKGFLLNGEPIEMKGGCLHHDNGLLGAAAFRRAEERRVEIMKANGYNAIRTSHNPPSAYFLDACDRLGILVIDEAFDQWEKGKNPDDYHLFFNEWWKKDVQAMVLRDRNHPSVIFWSIGNEIQERADTSGVRIAHQLKEAIRECDTTRPVTAAICDFWDNKNLKWTDISPAFSALDIAGYNYQWRQYEPDHKQAPNRIMMATESFPFEIYENWEQVKKHPYVIGDFIWTGMDYLGEAGIGHSNYDTTRNFGMPWPWYVAWCGDIDIIGNKKAQSYYHDVVWGRSELEMLVHEPIPVGQKENVSGWGWPLEYPHWSFGGAEGKELAVRIFSNGDHVKLFLNSKMVGEKSISVATKLIAVFNVPFAAGELKAVAFRDGKEIATKIFTTPGVAFTLKLVSDRTSVTSDRNELCYVNVEVIDEKGNLVPDAVIPLSVTLAGPAELLAAGNACPDCMSSHTSPEFKTWQGRGLIILRPTLSAGKVLLKVSSPGIKEATAHVEVVIPK
jgi:beta-galactosidase